MRVAISLLSLHNANLIRISQPIVIFLLTAFIASTFSVMGTDPHHDGIMLKPAMDVSEGMILFKETFSQYGALTVLLQATSISIFGKYLIVIRLLTAMFYALTSIVLWFMFRKIIPDSLSTVACLVWLFLAPYYFWTFLPWSSVYALFFQILSIYFLLLFVESNSLWFLYLSGISCALTYWCRQPVGVFLLCAIIGSYLFLVLLRNSDYKQLLKKVTIFCAGFFSVSLVFIIWLQVNGALRDWWLQSTVLALNFPSWAGNHVGWSPLKVLKELGPRRPGITSWYGRPYPIMWAIIPLSCVIVFAKTLIDGFKEGSYGKRDHIILALSFVCFASWLQYYPLPDDRHCYWAVSPMIGLFFYFLYEICFKNQSRHEMRLCLTIMVVLSLCYGEFSFRVFSGIKRLEQERVQISVPKVLKGMNLSQRDAIYYKKAGKVLDCYSEKHLDRTIITTGRNALYLTFIQRSGNFHAFYVGFFLPNLLSLYPDYYEKLNIFVKERKPLLVETKEKFKGYVEIYTDPSIQVYKE